MAEKRFHLPSSMQSKQTSYLFASLTYMHCKRKELFLPPLSNVTSLLLALERLDCVLHQSIYGLFSVSNIFVHSLVLAFSPFFRRVFVLICFSFFRSIPLVTFSIPSFNFIWARVSSLLLIRSNLYKPCERIIMMSRSQALAVCHL